MGVGWVGEIDEEGNKGWVRVGGDEGEEVRGGVVENGGEWVEKVVEKGVGVEVVGVWEGEGEGWGGGKGGWGCDG